MDAQNRNQDANTEPRDKFPEPKGWALKWDGFFPAVAAPTVDLTEVKEPQPENGEWDKFPEPRGWAANWDGSALSELDARQNGRAA